MAGATPEAQKIIIIEAKTQKVAPVTCQNVAHDMNLAWAFVEATR